MKVAHLSNIANVGYMNTRALRKKGVDARLYFNPHDPYGISNPAWEDSDLTESRPEWLVEWEVNKNILNPFYHLRHITEFRQFDVLHAYTLSPMFAMFTGVPYIAQTTGADINEVAQGNNILGYLYRKSLKRARTVLFSNFNQLPLIIAIGLKNARFMPFSIDTDKYNKGNTVHSEKGLVLLHSSRLDWKSKGNDMFFRSFSRFVKDVTDSIVYVLSAGPDLERTRKLVEDLGISNNVRFILAAKKEDLVGLYHNADIVVDQFIVGGLGINALEAMSCAKPVLIYCDNKSASSCYADLPPVLNANSEDEILSRLKESVDLAHREDIGNKARQWIIKYHDRAKVADILLEIYEKILNGDNQRCG